jgi:hypothetical protein
MIIGTHVVIASKNPEADHAFFRDVLKLTSADAGGGYMIFGLPPSEASIHGTEGNLPNHEIYLLCDEIEKFSGEMKSKNIDCSEVQDTGWGRLVRITLPSGAPLSVYQPRYKRPD